METRPIDRSPTLNSPVLGSFARTSFPEDYSKIRGFNYQPSWASTGFNIWHNFNGERMGHELALGKCYFPGMNAIRLWLSHDAWQHNPGAFAVAFDTALSIAATHSISVMPVLFNRWHDAWLDYGGIYIDHFLPKVSGVQENDPLSAFAEAIVGAHATDSRIFAWDLCNEPFSYSCPKTDIPDIVKAEYAWLERTYNLAKRCGAQAPITVGIHMGHRIEGIRQIEPISDVLSIHPYWISDGPACNEPVFEKMLDDYVQFATGVGKPLIATETCWGATDDAKRVDIIRNTLSRLKARGIGWLVYGLHHSLTANLHRAEFGPFGDPGPGILAFIEADGRLRPGHDVFNEY